MLLDVARNVRLLDPIICASIESETDPIAYPFWYDTIIVSHKYMYRYKPDR